MFTPQFFTIYFFILFYNENKLLFNKTARSFKCIPSQIQLHYINNCLFYSTIWAYRELAPIPQIIRYFSGKAAEIEEILAYI